MVLSVDLLTNTHVSTCLQSWVKDLGRRRNLNKVSNFQVVFYILLSRFLLSTLSFLYHFLSLRFSEILKQSLKVTGSKRAKLGRFGVLGRKQGMESPFQNLQGCHDTEASEHLHEKNKEISDTGVRV